jgi:hypothetical protein
MSAHLVLLAVLLAGDGAVPDPNALPFPIGAPPVTADGPAVTACLGYGRTLLSVSYQLPLLETEVSRYSAWVGAECGLLAEWYLGSGVCAELALENLAAGSLFAPRLGVAWWPIEGLAFTIGFDPVGGRWDVGWRFFP